MTRSAPLLLISLVLAASITVSGCTGTIHHKKSGAPQVEAKSPGPPPHAPAHGYRYEHPNGKVLIYDSSIGVYVASGYDYVYFHKSRYYRLRNGSWQISVKMDGPWDLVSVTKIPPGLQKKSNQPGAVMGANKKGKKKKDK